MNDENDDKPPLRCAECGGRRWNDHTVVWVNGWPYCVANGCAAAQGREAEIERLLHERP